MAVMVLAGCDTGGSGGPSRGLVANGTFHTKVLSYPHTVTMNVATTFQSNAIVRISIGQHGEHARVLEKVRRQLIPQIIREQSTGIEAIAGAVWASGAIIEAVEDAIHAAGGNAAGWRTPPCESDRTVVLHAGYHEGEGVPFDVVVVGMGAAGLSAYLRAASLGASVFGIESTGFAGGNSMFSENIQVYNSSGRAAKFHLPANYSGDLNDWLRVWDRAMDYTSCGVLDLGFRHRAEWQGRQGPGKPEVAEMFVRHSGRWLSFILANHDFPILRPFSSGSIFGGVTGTGIRPAWMEGLPTFGGTGSATGLIISPFANNSIVINPDGIFSNMGNDDTAITTGAPLPVNHAHPDRHKGIVYERALADAAQRNPRADHMINLKVAAILTDDNTPEGRIAGVKAVHRDGSTWLIYGNNIILATGGFAASPELTQRFLGGTPAGLTEVRNYGCGITMALRDANAATYNANVPGLPGGTHLFSTRVDGNPIPAAGTPGRPAVMWSDNQRASQGMNQTLNSISSRNTTLWIALGEGSAPGMPNTRARRVNAANMAGIGNNISGHRHMVIFSNDVLNQMRIDGVGAVETDDGGVGVSWGSQVNAAGTGTSDAANVPFPYVWPLIDHHIGVNTHRAAALEALGGLAGFNNGEVEQMLAEVAGHNAANASNSQTDPNLPLRPAASLRVRSIEEQQTHAAARLAHYRSLPATEVVHTTMTAAAEANRTTVTAAQAIAIWEDFTPGFTAILRSGYPHSTAGGLDVNANMQVLRYSGGVTAGAPVPGLYAGGELTLGNKMHRYGDYNPVAWATMHGWAWTSGFLAAEHAVLGEILEPEPVMAGPRTTFPSRRPADH